MASDLCSKEVDDPQQCFDTHPPCCVSCYVYISDSSIARIIVDYKETEKA